MSLASQFSLAVQRIGTEFKTLRTEVASATGLRQRVVSVDLRDWTDFATGGGATGNAGIGTALNAALAQAAADGALAQVVIPRSTTTAPIVLDKQILLQSGVTLQGARGRTRLRVADGVTQNILRADAKTGISIFDLDIDGRSDVAPAAASMIYLTNCVGAHLENLRVHDSAGASSAISISGTTELVLRRVRASHGLRAISVSSSPEALLEDVIASRARSFANVDANIYLGSSDRAVLRQVRGFAGNSHGLYLANSHYVRIVQSRFDHAGYMGINALDGSTLTAPAYTDEGFRRGISASQASPSTHLTLDGVLLDANQENGCILFGDHATVTNSEATSNNLMGAVGGHGFEVNGEHATITNNRASGNNNGISANSKRQYIAGNKCWSNRGTMGCGIKSYNGFDRVITANECWDNGTGIDVNADTGTVVPGVIVTQNDLHENGVGLFVSDEIDTPDLTGNRIHDNTTTAATTQCAQYRMGSALFDGATHTAVSLGAVTGAASTLPVAPRIMRASESWSRADTAVGGSLGSTDNKYGGVSSYAWTNTGLQIKNGELYSNTLSAFRLATIDLGAVDGIVESALTRLAGGAALVLRYTDVNNYMALVVTSAGAMSIQKRVAGTSSTVVALSGTAVAGDTLAFYAFGNLFRAYRNGVALNPAGASDTALPGGTMQGLREGFSAGESSWGITAFYDKLATTTEVAVRADAVQPLSTAQRTLARSNLGIDPLYNVIKLPAGTVIPTTAAGFDALGIPDGALFTVDPS